MNFSPMMVSDPRRDWGTGSSEPVRVQKRESVAERADPVKPGRPGNQVVLPDLLAARSPGCEISSRRMKIAPLLIQQGRQEEGKLNQAVRGQEERRATKNTKRHKKGRSRAAPR